MKTIIACTDFTQSSFNACKYAAFLAQKLNCKLTIFNLFESPVIHSNLGLYGYSFASIRKDSRQKTQKIINKLSELFPSVKINPFISTGSFKSELESFTKQHQIQAAVMGLESKDKISKFIYGSHGFELIGKISSPVIIVPSTYKLHQLNRLVLAVDNSEKLHKTSLKSLENIVAKNKIELALLHIRTEDEIFIPVVKQLKINKVVLPIEVQDANNLQEGLKKYCGENKIDLIATISQNHSVFYNFFVESDTKKISVVSKVPVMALHE